MHKKHSLVNPKQILFGSIQSNNKYVIDLFSCWRPILYVERGVKTAAACPQRSYFKMKVVIELKYVAPWN